MSNNSYDAEFDAAGRKYNVDPRLGKTVFHMESGGGANTGPGVPGDPDSPIGPMQIRPSTARSLGISDPRDVHQAIDAGMRYLAQGLNLTQSPEGALKYYYGGPNQSEWGPKTQAYAARGAALYPQMAIDTPAPASQDAPTTGAAPVADNPKKLTGADIRNSFATAAAAPDTTAPAAASAQDVSPGAKIRAMFPTADSAPAAPAAPSIDPITGFPVDDSGAPIQGGKTVNAGQDQGRIIPGTPLSGLPKTIDEARADLNSGAAPGYVSMAPLPIQLKETTPGSGVADPNSGLAGLKMDWLAPIRGAGNAALDLLEGTKTGVVTPAATSLLAGAAMGGGLTPSIARGTGQGIAETAEYGRPLADQYAARPTAADRVQTAPSLEADTPPNALASSAPAVADNALVGRPGIYGGTPDVTRGPFEQQAAPTANPLSTAPATAAVPQSVGAAASRDLSHPSTIGISPAQVQAYRSTAEGQKLLEPQQPGIADETAYVPGVTPNQSEIEQSVNTARELKALNVSAPEVSQAAKEIASENNDARQRFFSNLAGSDVDVSNAMEARSAQAEKDLATAFGNKKPTDAQPVVDTINGILKDPRDSENTAVQQYVKPLIARLTNADGTLKSDPEQLYGIREDIARMQSKAAKAETPTLDHVNGQLQDIKGALDGVIEQGAPGYQQYLQNFSEASRPIDTMQALQGFENKLYDSQNRMGYNKVQTMMRQIVDSRAAPGLNPFKSIPDDTMQQLWNLRDDLRRSASAQELARAPGSDTVQNAWDAAKGVGKKGAEIAAHGLILSHTGPVGNLAANALKSAVMAGSEKRAAAKATARGMELLRPKTQLRNPLQTH